MEKYTPAIQEKLNSLKISREQTLKLSISCEFQEDQMVQVDPKAQMYCETWFKNRIEEEWINIDRSEIKDFEKIMHFKKSPIFEYKFEQRQLIRFEFYVKQPDTNYIHSVLQTQVGDLVRTIGGQFKSCLIDPISSKIVGEINLEMESLRHNNWTVVINLDITGLKSKKEMLRLKSIDHPFLIIKWINQTNENGEEDAEIVWQTNPKEEITTNPSWNLGETSLEYLCFGDLNKKLRFEIWCHQKNGKHRFYGQITNTVKQFVKTEGEGIDIINKHGEKHGKVVFNNFWIVSHPTMMDYIRSGWNLSLSVAVDFTASNGAFNNPESLHYIDPNNPSKLTVYEEVITKIGSIIESYNTDEVKFPSFGFGAIPYYMQIDEVDHWFNLNGKDNPEEDGVEGILASYRNTINNNVVQAGPTILSQWIQVINDFIKEREECTDYHIMLCITDGAWDDFSNVLQEIVNASKSPLSIIVVGVGNGRFGKMEQIDNSKGVLWDYSDRLSNRDAITFVEYNRFKDNSTGFVRKWLKDIPLQLVHYMENNRITPSPLIHPDINLSF